MRRGILATSLKMFDTHCATLSSRSSILTTRRRMRPRRLLLRLAGGTAGCVDETATARGTPKRLGRNASRWSWRSCSCCVAVGESDHTFTLVKWVILVVVHGSHEACRGGRGQAELGCEALAVRSVLVGQGRQGVADGAALPVGNQALDGHAPLDLLDAGGGGDPLHEHVLLLGDEPDRPGEGGSDPGPQPMAPVA